MKKRTVKKTAAKKVSSPKKVSKKVVKKSKASRPNLSKGKVNTKKASIVKPVRKSKANVSKAVLSSKVAVRTIAPAPKVESVEVPVSQETTLSVATKSEAIAIVEPVVTAPTRAPVRKVIGANGVVLSVKERTTDLPVAINTMVPTAIAEEIPAPVIEEAKPVVIPVAPKLAWNKLPQAIPAHIKFLVNSAMKECERAANLPLPFAKFIAAAPQEIGGLEFALVLLSLEHSAEQIAALCEMERMQVEVLINAGSAAISDFFSSLCPEMERKCRALLAGQSSSADSLIERHLLSGIDENFQMMLWAVTLKCIRASSPVFSVCA